MDNELKLWLRAGKEVEERIASLGITPQFDGRTGRHYLSFRGVFDPELKMLPRALHHHLAYITAIRIIFDDQQALGLYVQDNVEILVEDFLLSNENGGTRIQVWFISGMDLRTMAKVTLAMSKRLILRQEDPNRSIAYPESSLFSKGKAVIQ